MSESSAEANEADRLEQQRSVVDDDVTEGMGPELSPLDANEADVLEQHALLPDDDEDDYS
ncbi:MAG: hypothetical protein QOK15_3202 [Nocardioidaceae bacterium]|jgi:hypothetical protein|nr:hypothetical protein [Nocardioidaceae bacterium]